MLAKVASVEVQLRTVDVPSVMGLIEAVRVAAGGVGVISIAQTAASFRPLKVRFSTPSDTATEETVTS